MAAAGYDPGKQTLAVKNADGTWRIPSFREGGEVYIVCLETRSCSCPSAKHRPEKPCKHLLACSSQSVWLEYAAKAATCTDAQLETLLVKYADCEMISGAIRAERHARKADRTPAPASLPSQAQLRSIFA